MAEGAGKGIPTTVRGKIMEVWGEGALGRG